MSPYRPQTRSKKGSRRSKKPAPWLGPELQCGGTWVPPNLNSSRVADTSWCSDRPSDVICLESCYCSKPLFLPKGAPCRPKIRPATPSRTPKTFSGTSVRLCLLGSRFDRGLPRAPKASPTKKAKRRICWTIMTIAPHLLELLLP